MEEDAESELAKMPPARRFKKRYIFYAVFALLVLTILIAWLQRKDIADQFIQDELKKTGARVTYEIEDIGFRTQKVSNLVVGDPANPDLIVRDAEIDVALGFGGATVQWVRAKGVRLRGKLLPDGKFSFGELDKFLDPDSKEPFEFPDFALDLDDASLALNSPWGAIGLGIEGRGQLRGQFEGEAALRSRKLSYQGCNIGDLRFDGAIALDAGKPSMLGPLQAASVNCRSQGIAISRPVLDADFQLNETFDRWVGSAGFKAAKVALSGQAITAPAGNFEINGGIERSSFKLALDDGGYRSDLLSVRQMVMSGEGRFGMGENGFSLAMRGEGEIAGGRADASLAASLDGAAESTRDTPVGPLLARIGPAARKALSSFDAGAKFDFAVPARTATKIDIDGFDIASASGARIRQAGALRLQSGRGGWSLATPLQIAMSGGDLPTGKLALRRSGSSGWAGTLSLDPYASGTARLALSNMNFSGRPGGSWRFDGNANVSGPLADGRIEGLRMPIDGNWNGSRLALYDGCRNFAFDHARISGVSLARQNIRVCPDGGAIFATGAGGTQVKARLPNFAFRGRLGGTMVDLKTSVVRFNLDQGFNASNVKVELGAADSMTSFAASSVNGRFDRRGISGSLSGGEGQIANVPMLMDNAAGDWTYRDGNVRLVAALGFTDAEELDRFLPMQVPEIIVDYEDGTITAIGDVFEPTTQTRVAGVDIRHVLANGEGRALFAVDDLRFGSAFQPELLTPLTLGVVANVDGSVYGDGQIAWDNSGDGIRSTGTFGTKSLNLAAAFGVVDGLSTELKFTDLLSLETAPGQVANIATINPGIAAFGGVISYKLLPDQKVEIEGGRWPFAGGELIIERTVWDFGVEKPRNLVMRVKGIEVAQFIEQFDFDNLTATGTFDGVLPMTFDEDGGRIVGGELISQEGGGNISYIGELTYEDLSPYANFAFDALKSLDYNRLRIGMNGDLGGEIITVINFAGVKQGTGAKKNFITRQLASIPIEFNLVIEAQFFQLMSSIREFYDPEFLVQKNLPELIKKQQEFDRLQREAGAASAETKINEGEQAVQPSESKDGV